MSETLELVHSGARYTLHSQPETGQDRWVLETLGFKTGGFFVEIGAFDGVYHSNTLTLERDFGWRGVLIEAVETLAAKAKKNRRAAVLNRAIGPDAGLHSFFDAGQWGGLCEFTRPNLLRGHTVYGNPTVELPTVSLLDALNKENLPSVIDYLSIDIEGAEYPVLNSYLNHPSSHMFRCITVEVGVNRDDLPKLVEMMAPLGYRLDRVVAWDAFFVNDMLVS